MVLWQFSESGCHSVWLWVFYRIEYISVHLVPPFCNGTGCFLCPDLYRLDWTGLPYSQWFLLSSCCLTKKCTSEWPQGYMPGCLPNRLVSSLRRVQFTWLRWLFKALKLLPCCLESIFSLHRPKNSSCYCGLKCTHPCAYFRFCNQSSISELVVSLL